MELTIEQLAIYLPYKLQIGQLDDVIISIDVKTGSIETLFRGHLRNLYDVNDAVLICHPLSDLTKEITVKGYNDDKPFVPIHWLANWLYDEEPDGFYNVPSAKNWIELNIFMSIGNLPHKIVIELVKLGFWIYDQEAFKEGTIIDINSLK